MDVCVFDTCIHETIFNLLISISEVVSDGSDIELLKNRSLLSLIFLLGQVGSDVEIFSVQDKILVNVVLTCNLGSGYIQLMRW